MQAVSIAMSARVPVCACGNRCAAPDPSPSDSCSQRSSCTRLDCCGVEVIRSSGSGGDSRQFFERQSGYELSSALDSLRAANPGLLVREGLENERLRRSKD